jgi:hypothetical protein
VVTYINVYATMTAEKRNVPRGPLLALPQTPDDCLITRRGDSIEAEYPGFRILYQ